MSEFNFEQVIKYWMHNPADFFSKSNKAYPISWFRESFSLLEAMFCELYGLPKCREFKDECDIIAHHTLLIGERFNWEQILSVMLKESIEKYQNVATSMKLTFYM